MPCVNSQACNVAWNARIVVKVLVEPGSGKAPQSQSATLLAPAPARDANRIPVIRLLRKYLVRVPAAW